MAGAPDDQSLIIYQEHGSEIFVVNFLGVELFLIIVLGVFNDFDWHSVGFSLSIEGVDLILFRIVEAFLREILSVTIHYNFRVLLNFSS